MPRRPVLIAAFALLIAASGAAAPATAGPAPARANLRASIPAPRHHGTLRVRGDLRDGDTVRAAGLSWSPGPLPRGDRLLSFEVGYYWQACAAHGHCVVAADTTATPFAAQRYVAGHADTGRHLKITETATEVVQASSTTFSFSIKSVSVSTTTGGTVAAYRAGKAPATEFVNGTPEPRTASAEEYFQIDPPHYRAAAGPVSQRYRVDTGPWRPLPASRVFYTGKLKPGPHQVAVRTADRAGASTLRFGWHVVPMPAPLPCRPAAHRRCWYPPHLDATHHPMRWDWQIGRAAAAEPAPWTSTTSTAS